MEIARKLLPDVYVFNVPEAKDDRGWLSVTFEFGIMADLTKVEFEIWQTMISNSNKNVIRGLHYQVAPYRIAKLISCIRGEIYDVVVDLRPNSPTYGYWVCIELNEDDSNMLFVPSGFAHGYTSLTDGSEVLYYQDGCYSAKSSRILAWNDPDLNIRWPVDNPILSERDQTQGISWQDYKANPEF